MRQLIDLASVKEFMAETLDKVEEQYLVQMADDMEIKSAYFQKVLAPEYLSQATEEELLQVLRFIFSIKRKAKEIIESIGLNDLKSAIYDLIYGRKMLEIRFQTFCNRIKLSDKYLRADLASELLHFTKPDEYWLWTRWMWNPRTKTGSLPLVVTENFELKGNNLGEIYINVGRAVAFVHSMSESGGYRFISERLFGTNVFLSCVYVIYAYTVLKMRMTKEFNKVMPGVVEFSRRILGLYRIRELDFLQLQSSN